MNKKTNSPSKGKFKPTIAFWNNSNGTGYRAVVDEEVAEILSTIKPGSRLALFANDSDNPKAPAFKITVYDADSGRGGRAPESSDVV